jgi:uncharacterized iron-regulated membrane protein
MVAPSTLVTLPTLFDAWRQLGRITQGIVLLVAIVLGICLPVLGWSLLIMLTCDLGVSLKASVAARTQDQH